MRLAWEGPAGCAPEWEVATVRGLHCIVLQDIRLVCVCLHVRACMFGGMRVSMGYGCVLKGEITLRQAHVACQDGHEMEEAAPRAGGSPQ